jgi:bacterioferritin-associated ferredoxin
MYVCLCRGVTDTHIRRAVASGTDRFCDLRRELNLASQCGKCGLQAREIFQQACGQLPVASTTLFYSATEAAA